MSGEPDPWMKSIIDYGALTLVIVLTPVALVFMTLGFIFAYLRHAFRIGISYLDDA
jgi:hypothetical protein